VIATTIAENGDLRQPVPIIRDLCRLVAQYSRSAIHKIVTRAKTARAVSER